MSVSVSVVCSSYLSPNSLTPALSTKKSTSSLDTSRESNGSNAKKRHGWFHHRK